MQVHWFDFLVSLINFLVFAVAFKFIVIEPMQRAVVEREQSARRRLEEAEDLLLKAEKLLKEYEEVAQGFEAEQIAMRQAAERERERQVARIEEEGRLEAEHILEKARAEIELMRSKDRESFRREVVEQALLEAQKALSEGLDESLRVAIAKDAVGKVDKLSVA